MTHSTDESRIHFLHIGKTGGTALVHAIKSLGANGRDIRDVHLHGHAVRLPDIPVGEKVFFCLRNPITRYVSGFYSRLRKGRPRYQGEWTEGEAAAFARFETADALARAIVSQDQAVSAAAHHAMRQIDHVKTSVWDWLISPAYLRSRAADIAFIAQQEWLTDDASVLSEILGLGPLHLPDDDVDAHRNPAHFDKTLCTQGEDNIRRWYRNDFDAIEVCREIASGNGMVCSLTRQYPAASQRKKECMESRRKLIVVLGSPRSGTSATTRGLKALGVELGERLMEANAHVNAKGYWEDVDLHAVNLELEREVGGDWDTLGPMRVNEVAQGKRDELHARAVVLLRERLAGGMPFGFKDPRTTRVLPFWQPVFEQIDADVRYVIALRNPLSVAFSMARAVQMPQEKAHVLWLEYMVDAVLDSRGCRRVLIDFDVLMTDPLTQLGRMATGVGLPAPQPGDALYEDYAGEFLDNSLRHAEFTVDDLDRHASMLPEVVQAYAMLRRVACDEIALDDDDVTALFTRLRTRLTSLAPLLLGYRSRENRERQLVRDICARDASLAESARLSEQVQSQVAGVVEAVKTQLENYVSWSVAETRLVDAKVAELKQGLEGRSGASDVEHAVRSLADELAALRDRQADAIGALSGEIRAEFSAQASRVAEREAVLRTTLTETEAALRRTLLDNEAALGETRLANAREVAEWRAAASAAEGQRVALQHAVDTLDARIAQLTETVAVTASQRDVAVARYEAEVARHALETARHVDERLADERRIVDMQATIHRLSEALGIREAELSGVERSAFGRFALTGVRKRLTPATNG
ncbi:sulfotransferase family 2 domain-containing protein [Burkholderia arboris]|uniref:sulfotransferase family 2 domain-containing protein n=1 Tax=Burkholderia arboris TaxID=488730 RepID=UPI0012D9B25A|nr:sulfotransferase family 2 domain-containing protein [Burkholderia arboris]MCA8490786.1 sulfotransferase family 2 domain-containing protein [Burkholderia arboris]UTV59637.1 sulfotransferase family 2 domain-containing protein [Burkholderia arboris]